MSPKLLTIKKEYILKEVVDTYLENAFTPSKSLIDYKKRRFSKNFLDFLPEDKNSMILDIGPGLGEILDVCHELGYNYASGIDISPSVVSFLKKRNIPCELTDSSAKWLEARPSKYDMIFMLDVLEHISKHEVIQQLKACYTALTSNGCLLIMVPNGQATEGFLHRNNDITHEVAYTPHTLSQVLISSGITNFQFYPFEEYCETETAWIRDVRKEYLDWIRFTRKLTHNLNGEILSPEFFAVIYKGEKSQKFEFSEEAVEPVSMEKLEEVFNQLNYHGIVKHFVKEYLRIKEQEINIQQEINSIHQAIASQKRKIKLQQQIVKVQQIKINVLQKQLERQSAEISYLMMPLYKRFLNQSRNLIRKIKLWFRKDDDINVTSK